MCKDLAKNDKIKHYTVVPKVPRQIQSNFCEETDILSGISRHLNIHIRTPNKYINYVFEYAHYALLLL
jgi:hypothetical protein